MAKKVINYELFSASSGRFKPAPQPACVAPFRLSKSGGRGAG